MMTKEEKAVSILDEFTKTWCRDDSQEELTFNCDKCQFRDGKLCRVKMFHVYHYPAHKNFGSMS